MASLRTMILVSVALGVSTAGCASLMTNRAIDAFTESLAQADADELRSTTSERFQREALRLPEAVEDFKVLDIPTGKMSVLKVEDISDDMKHVTVEVGKSGEEGKKLEYQLKRETGSRTWVVDDVFVTAAAAGRADPVTQSVAAQMDLLLTVREFIQAWNKGTREEVLQVTAPELQSVLAELPPAYLQQLTSQVVDGSQGRISRPAEVEGNNAIVIIPRAHGKLLIRLSRHEDNWRVNDVAAETDDDHAVASTRDMAASLRTVVQFLNAYTAADRKSLSASATPTFFKATLQGADPSEVPLPTINLLAARYEYRPHDKRRDVILPHGQTSYMFSLVAAATPQDSLPAQLNTFQVDEVTIYDDATAQVKRLSSLFTAHAIVEVFAEALAARDRTKLAALSTVDFNERAWNGVDNIVLQALPLPEIEAATPHVVATVFQGQSAEITVTQGAHPLTYVLRAARGRMLVDDVLLPVTKRPSSLKANLETLIPLYSFALGVHHNNIDLLKQQSGMGLNRIVWSQARSVPDVGFELVEHLTMPIHSIAVNGEQSTIELGDGIRRTRVLLVREGPRFVVQDVHLAVGDGPGQQIELLQAMRHVMAGRNTYAGGALPPTSRTVVPASAEVPASR
jgi:hypothetical protein